MRVKSCCKKDVEEVSQEKTLTYAQILLEEGVYQTTQKGLDYVYLIVVKHPYNLTKPCVLWYNNSQDTLQPAADSWNSAMYTYIKTDKQVCFELV